ncbi:SDR family oxidoreductase [Luteimonas sp. TWI1416]|uniref:SDR family oxidoreductase n=1 Tax=unclassified Luteimonas TaxID=2629088 RepID=UPI00320B3518
MRAFLDCMPLGRLGEPVDIARAVLFLASNDAGFVTGVNLPVDGGVSASNGQPLFETD